MAWLMLPFGVLLLLFIISPWTDRKGWTKVRGNAGRAAGARVARGRPSRRLADGGDPGDRSSTRGPLRPTLVSKKGGNARRNRKTWLQSGLPLPISRA